jgi:predicted RND superfamily exporter protein
MLKTFYKNYLLKYPKIFLAIMSIVVVMIAMYAVKLEIDASSETLLLENDKDLEFTREISKKFSAPDFLVVTYSVNDDLLSNKNLDNIRDLSKRLLGVPNVESITNITNVPLLQSPIVPITELVKKVPTLDDKGIDKTLVKKEFLNSPIYKQNLVSEDFKTTAFLLNLKYDAKYFELLNERDKYTKLKKEKSLNAQEQLAYQNAQKALKEYRDIQRLENHNNITNIREILATFEKESGVKLYLGGVAMIADDMVEFVKSDLSIFGIVIVILVIGVLSFLFKELRWVVLPITISFISIIITSGLFALFSWEITVISSNFISLQLIMNMSLVVHLIVKYKELEQIHHSHTYGQLIVESTTSMAKPSFFVVITTIAGFSSLVYSGILPVINFGWMMSVGIVVSLVCTFLLFPLFLILFSKKGILQKSKNSKPFTLQLSKIALYHRATIFVLTLLVVVFSISGAMKLRVENSFIDYFKTSTEIYQGMSLIDKKLGGTTPLDIIIAFKENSDEVQEIAIVEDDEDEMLDEFSDEFESSEDDKIKYWFTESKMERIKTIHEYLEKQNGVGKVLSLHTLGAVGKKLNDGKNLDSLSLALMYQELPEKYRKIVLTPYVNVESNRVRISSRIIDSKEGLQRNELLKKIDSDLKQIVNPQYEEYQISNLLVIYNNMLQSLFESQIKTIGVVIGIIFIMFLILFKDIKIAILAIIANTVPVSVIFGIMGWLDIPLDMMTITIAAISIGIAVDNTIHYIHRFKLERADNSYIDAVTNAHKNIGTAMFYTSLIIMIGFSILMLSNFIPTIYFGVLTMIAMFMAIVADLLLLPALLYFYKK